MDTTVELYCEERGKGPLPLMLVHGFPFDHSLWNEVAAHLESETRLLLPDLRGYGLSPVPDGIYTMESMAADLKALLDRLGVQRVALAGHSMGGYVALAFAEAYPERLAGLAMVTSAAAADAPERKTARYQQAEEIARQGVGILEGSLERYSPMAEARERVRGWMRRARPAAVQSTLMGMAERHDRLEVLAGLRVPVEIISGDLDTLIPMERSREMAEKLWDGNLTILPGAGHMSMLEMPASTAAALRAFMARCVNAGM
ncbi:MAG: alpha/beta fold hydrolase [Anaerolineaceae bacterium]|nr:alpha/beta fold hydrolase [Anaerolineaceae bacterium]